MNIFDEYEYKTDLRCVTTKGIDQDKTIPAAERTGSEQYAMAMLCKQDKEQLDRIEYKLNLLLAETGE